MEETTTFKYSQATPVEASKMTEVLHPYVVFLPAEQKERILGAIFGSKAAVDILRFSLRQGISNKIYQKDLVRNLAFSNKTIIETLKSLTKLGVLTESMEKAKRGTRTVWIKSYQLSDMGKWSALLIAEEDEISDMEKVEILQTAFRRYLRWVKILSENLHVDTQTLEKIFRAEIAGN